MSTPEEKAREQIDPQLNAAGWLVQDLNEINLSAQRGVAIRELSSSGGLADYVLFADGKVIGLAEPWVPKTLIFAKTDEHAEEIVTSIREKFGKGDDSCTKITSKADAMPEQVIKVFRAAPEDQAQIAV
jgi:type I site-specific restriction endonuclease